ncbi:parallel beta-helix domain-containing protein [Agrilutibacter solisilvae]|nr:parallel beta-helix domain-containing protein [Lysobacter solisilvae]
MAWTSAVLACAAALAGCQQKAAPVAVDRDYQKVLIERLLDAKPGDVIDIPAGTFAFDRSLSLRVDGVTLRGAGMDKTVLSFRNQKSGAEGLLVNASDFTIENLAIEDSKGDGLKVNEGENITIRGVRVEWTRGPHTDNGAYGLYPVQTKNVLIEDCVVIGASDAGVYVGQSETIIVRRNRAERNVAGIEIENSKFADVYGNTAIDNTGGILVFDMPNLPRRGHSTRVFGNRVVGNNTDNFARKGAAVASVPAGSGIVLNSADKVEIFDNDIGDNKTANVIISSYWSTGYMNKYGVSKDYDPYPEEVYVHGNRFQGGGDSPDGLDLKALRVAMFGLSGRLPDVLWDGFANAKRSQGPQICVEGASGVLNADGPNKYKSPSMAGDAMRCSLPRLPQVSLPTTGVAATAKVAPAA